MFITVEYNIECAVVPPDKDRLFIAWLGPRQSLSTTVRGRFARRGLHELPPATAETSASFGMFRRTRSAGEPTRLLVLPKVHPISRLALAGSTGDAALRPHRVRIGDQIAGSRTYMPGDPWKHIHWRNTARTARPQIKEFEQSADNSLVIALDASRAKKESADALEHAIRIAASVGDFVCRSGGIVRLVTEGLDSTTSSRDRLLEQLALVEGDGEMDVLSLLHRARPGSNVLAIVPETCEQIEAFHRLQGDWHRVTVVILLGFGPTRPSTGPIEGSYPSTACLVDCWPNGVSEALAALERTSRARRWPAGVGDLMRPNPIGHGT